MHEACEQAAKDLDFIFYIIVTSLITCFAIKIYGVAIVCPLELHRKELRSGLCQALIICNNRVMQWRF